MAAFGLNKPFNSVQIVFFSPPWVVLLEPITTHMCDGPPISILNSGFLPTKGRARTKPSWFDVFFFFFKKKESLVGVAVGGSWEEITEERDWSPTYFQTRVGTECSKRACGGCGLITQLLRVYHDPLLPRRRCRTK